MELNSYKLGDCLSMIENGVTIKQKEGAEGYPITRIETLSNDRFNRDRLGYANVYDIDNYTNHILDDEDLIMSHINSRPFLGRTVIYQKKDNEVIIHGMNVLRIKTNRAVLNPFYAYYYFKTPHFRKAIDNIRTDAINQSSINTNNIKDITIHVPSISDQESVVETLRAIDKKIELNENMNTELEAMAKQLYDHWFVQFDFPFDFAQGKPDENGKPYKSSGGKMVWNEKLKREIPEGWEVVLISDLIEEKKSGDWGQDEMKGSYTLKVNCIRGADFKKPTNAPERFINSKNNNRLLEEDDIIVEISGGSPIQATGRSVYVSKGLLCHYNNSLTCSNFCQALTCCDKTIAPYFFYVWNMFYDNNVMFNYEGKTSGIKNLLIDMFLNNNWYLPPIQILSVFATTIKRLMSTKDSNVKEINHLTRLRDSLLPMLMNGQVTIE